MEEQIKALGLPAESITPELVAKFTALVEQQKAPVLSKNEEILAKHTDLNAFVTSLGGRDAIKALAEEKAKAKADAEAAIAQSGDIEAIRKQLQDQNKAIAAERDTLKNKLVDRDVSKKLNEAIRSANGNADLLEPFLRGRIKSDMDGDDIKISVLQANGTPMLGKDGSNASLKDLLDEFKSNATYAPLFKASMASGTGSSASGTTAHSGADNPWNPAKSNMTAQFKMIRENPEQAKAMAAQYGKTLSL